MKKLIVIFVAVFFTTVVEAGIVVTKKKAVTIGDVIVKEDKILVKVQMGKATGTITYAKDVLAWYTTHKKVTSHYMGAKYAYKKRKYKVAKFLAKLAAKKEPKYKTKAQELLVFIDNLDKIKDPLAQNEPTDDDY